MPDISEISEAFPNRTIRECENAGANTGTSKGTAVTSGTMNVKGSWAQLIASTAKRAVGLLIIMTGMSSAARHGLVDIGTGASGSEVVLIANLFIGCNAADTKASYLILIPIPAGTRIAARWQDSTGSTTIYLEAILLEEPEVPQSFPHRAIFPLMGGGTNETIGAVTGSSTGTTITAGAANTKGNWAQIVASSAKRTVWIVVMLGAPSASAGFLVDVGVGAAGSESVVVPNIYTNPGGIHDVSVFGLPVRIVAGTRVAARCQSSTASATIACVICLVEEA